MRRLAILAAAATLLGAASAHAQSDEIVFPPTAFALTVGSMFQQTPGELIVGNDEAIGNLTSAGPSITALGSTAPPGFTSQVVDVKANWNFEITGGPALIGGQANEIGIIINGLYTANTTNAATVANVLVGPGFAGLTHVYDQQCVNGLPPCGETPFSIMTLVQADTLQEIELHVGGVVTGATGNFSVTLDPIITLAPGFAEEGYVLQVAPDAQPPATGGVPEPATWALMILGFGGVGAALRGRRQAQGACGQFS